MGEVVYLDERRAERAPVSGGEAPVFFFDVADPMSYLAAERVERLLGAVDWVPVDGTRLSDRDDRDDRCDVRGRADACARSLRLPLVWPERFPQPAPRALRACMFACELGAGRAFALAAGRLGFCGGFDVEDPETLAEAAAAAGLPLEACMEAAGEAWRDDELRETAGILRRAGIRELPAVWSGGRWLRAEAELLSCGPERAESPPRRVAGGRRSRLSPVS